MAPKLRVAVIFGGRSGEHEVSLISAGSIIRAMDRRKYEIIPIAIDKNGHWLPPSEARRLLPEGTLPSLPRWMTDRRVTEIILPGDAQSGGLLAFDSSMRLIKRMPLDVVFPVLHGPYGEDGTIQGLLELADIPYVGCGVLASAAGMDKDMMKRLFRQAGLSVVDYLVIERSVWRKRPAAIMGRIRRKMGFPVFVKPANLGSSVGITKVKDGNGLKDAIELAAQFDDKILIEEAIDGREIEVSVLGNDDPIASLPGEIIPGAEFYDYTDKYISDAAQLIIPAKLPARLTAKLQRWAIRAFQAIEGSGMARVDFFIERRTGRLLVNEINTIPGFTSISMYPKLWEVSGIRYPELIDRLIELALERHRVRAGRRLTL
ncbi:MAG: D-alanine--D-alanine ligase [Acidobacteria bacterium]|nr:MAG: D-alanine--D-alanine ligase [Acidobacteriota bacterium]